MTTPLELVSATANPDKLAEIRAILGTRVALRERPGDIPDVVEDGDTLEDNARLKAKAIAAATGFPAVADDTGLVVDVLHGAPGVHSARYAGPEASYEANVAKLLDELRNVPDVDRAARFMTVALVAWPDGSEVMSTGTVEGRITRERRGTGRFGYDPVFEPLETPGITFAEMSDAEKNRISHRGRAFRTLLDLL